MKKLLSLALAICTVSTIFAQLPQSFGYQITVRNNNSVWGDAQVSARISILKHTATGTNVYTEQQTTTTNANGIAYFEVGKGTVESGVFTDIYWIADKYFIKTEIDPNGGNNYSITETTELKSVPYAIVSAKAMAFTAIDSLKAIYNHHFGELDSIIGLNINRLQTIDSLILIRKYSDSVFYKGIGLFATSDSSFISFSPANLWFKPSDTTWKMPNHQWDTAGQVNNSQLLDSAFSDWVDMLSWGSSGCNGIFPTDTATNGNHYGYGMNDLNGTCYDWGNINRIRHRDTIYRSNTWRTPTNDELIYIFSQRPNAANKIALATVNGITGLVILPDDWPGMPFGCSFHPGVTNWTDNSYNGVFWTAMESQGAVFLPASGYLHRANPMHCHDQSLQGFYWSETSSPNNDTDAYYMNFGVLYGVGGRIRLVLAPSTLCSRDFYHCVRLVKDHQNTD